MKIMKSVKVLAAVIASAMLSVNANAESLNSNAKAASPKSEIAGSAKNVDGVDKSVKFDYKIDEQGRVTSRVQKVWNSFSCEWEPVAAYSVSYSDSETVVTYGKYKRSNGTFTYDVQQLRLNASEYPYVFKAPAK